MRLLSKDASSVRPSTLTVSTVCQESICMPVSMSAMTLDVMIPTLRNLGVLLSKASAFADAKKLDGAETRHLVVPLRTRTLELDGLPFLQKWVLPSFYFHVTAAYAILRHNGVEIGKQDFLGSI
jgi:hypothetical protein